MRIGYDPSKSKVGNNTEFIKTNIIGDLEEVPGIDSYNKQKLWDQGIETTYQLIGYFLSLKGEGICPEEHCDIFYYKLREFGIKEYSHTITRVIAEKVDTIFPGIFSRES